MQQHSENVATMPLPPAFPSDFSPGDFYSQSEMAIVRDFLRVTLRTKGPEEFEKAVKGWTLEARAEVGRILAELRGQGFYPDRLDESGGIVWGIQLKSAIQVHLERYASHWLVRGQQVDDAMGGALVKIMAKIRAKNQRNGGVANGQ